MLGVIVRQRRDHALRLPESAGPLKPRSALTSVLFQTGDYLMAGAATQSDQMQMLGPLSVIKPTRDGLIPSDAPCREKTLQM
jgi:hypothetical protein